MAKYPRSETTIYQTDHICLKCGKPLKEKVIVTQVSWFRGEDEVERKEVCPVCENWKTVCKICGKVCHSEKGLTNHIRDKHLLSK
jgi:hypothetical protein